MSVKSNVLSQKEFVQKEQLLYPFEERGLQFGDGVYEVIRVYEGYYYLLNDHVERLFRSAQAIKLKLPYEKDELFGKLQELLRINEVTGDAKVYLQVTRGSAARDHVFPNCEPNFYAYVQDFPRKIDLMKQGVSTITQPDVRWQKCYIKSLNLLPNVLAKQEAHEHGSFEAILHKDGTVTECSSSNIYLIKDGTIYTHPKTDNILHGCVRSRIAEMTANLNIPFIEQPFTTQQIHEADELFLTSSTAEVMPITEVDGQKVKDGKPGNVTINLQKAYEKDANIAEAASIFTHQ